MQSFLIILGIIYFLLTIFCSIKFSMFVFKLAKEENSKIDILKFIITNLFIVIVLCADYFCEDDEDEGEENGY